MEGDRVLSEVVLKYDANNSVTPYVQLEKHTDLNLPPSNWLKNNLAGKFMTPKPRRPFDYSSLLMASRYPEVIGEVDVVSASDHIKKLMKMPFSSSSLSMTVHRIGKSLFIDHVDVPALLQSKLNEGKNLQWLRDLYCSATNLPQHSEFLPKKRNKEQSQLELIQSKFLHYSIEDVIEESNKKLPEPEEKQPLIQSEKVENSSIVVEPATLLVQNHEGIIDPEDDSALQPDFLRDVLWDFEDITMLVGSDLPIFGGGKYPAVSLRLRDSSKPISILTGIDYWLDNLMCNVPELIMCYHLKGIVQQYEQIKTADIPYMKDSSFSPNVVKDVAQNILSFLKSNCTKDGHTYWLFKSNKDDVIKLYDLTSICEEDPRSNRHDPFSMSVALLLYQIVRNMFITNGINNKNIAKARSLLQHCAALIEKENRPEISFLVNYLLTELYTRSVPNGDDTEGEFEDFESSSNDDELIGDTASSNLLPVSVQSAVELCRPSNSSLRSQTVAEKLLTNLDEETKCKKSLQFIINALKYLDTVYVAEDQPASSSESKSKPPDSGGKPDDLRVVPTFVMQEIHKTVRQDLSLMNIYIDTENTSAYDKLKGMLLEKAAKCYVALTNISISHKKFGRACRFARISAYCLTNVKKCTDNYLIAQLLMLYGDIMTMLAKGTVNIEAEIYDFHNGNELDSQMYNLLDMKTSQTYFEIKMELIDTCFMKTTEELLTIAVKSYEDGVSQTDNATDVTTNVTQLVELTRRLGNVRNELGALYLSKAASLAKQYGFPTAEEQDLWKKCFSCFESSIQAFQIVNDRVNLALLYSNCGRLMLLCAKVYGYSTRSRLDQERGQFTQQEKLYYAKAFEYYHKAISTLQIEETSPGIWLNISNELSDAYFSMATVLQDFAPLNTMAEEKLVKEISSTLMKVLQYGEPILNNKTGNVRNVIVLRIAMVHQRLASLYHHVLQNQLSDHGKKNYRSLAELHYKKVYTILEPTKHCIEILRVIILHAALHDYILKLAITFKNLRAKLDFFLSKDMDSSKALVESLKFFTQFHGKSKDQVQNMAKSCVGFEPGKFDVEEMSKIFALLEMQISSTIKEVLKFLSSKKQKPIDSLGISTAKRLYEIVIRGLNKRDNVDVVQRTAMLADVVQSMQLEYNG